MPEISQLNQSNVMRTALDSNQKTQKSSATANHLQLGGVTIKTVNSSDFEEMAMNLTNLKGLPKDKKDKKDKKSLEDALKARLKKVPDMPDAKQLNGLLQQIKNQAKSKNMADDAIKQMMKGYSEDPTHEYLALDIMIEQLEESQNPEDKALYERLKTYQKTFYRENKQDIKAGLNISNLAHEHSENSAFKLDELRDMWRHSLRIPELTSGSIAYNYAKERANNQYSQVIESIDWMRQALSNELGLIETDRSVDSTQLLYIRKQLEFAYGTKSTIILCQEVEQNIARLNT